jgi:uncharacterized Rossmann fold enzyme
MNERIQELAKQAGIFYYRKGKLQVDMEKFAELIVAECEKAIRAEIAVTDIDGEVEKAWEMGMECGVYTIKKHFGV